MGWVGWVGFAGPSATLPLFKVVAVPICVVDVVTGPRLPVVVAFVFTVVVAVVFVVAFVLAVFIVVEVVFRLVAVEYGSVVDITRRTPARRARCDSGRTLLPGTLGDVVFEPLLCADLKGCTPCVASSRAMKVLGESSFCAVLAEERAGACDAAGSACTAKVTSASSYIVYHYLSMIQL